MKKKIVQRLQENKMQKNYTSHKSDTLIFNAII